MTPARWSKTHQRSRKPQYPPAAQWGPAFTRPGSIPHRSAELSQSSFSVPFIYKQCMSLAGGKFLLTKLTFIYLLSLSRSLTLVHSLSCSLTLSLTDFLARSLTVVNGLFVFNGFSSTPSLPWQRRGQRQRWEQLICAFYLITGYVWDHLGQFPLYLSVFSLLSLSYFFLFSCALESKLCSLKV